VTTAATFRVNDYFRPTMLWDEAEKLSDHSNKQQIGILNAGYRRGTPIVRCMGEDATPELYDPFGMRALGAIGTLAATLLDRSIVIPMARAPKRYEGDNILMIDSAGHVKERFDEYSADEDTALIRRKLARWSDDHSGAIGRAVSTTPPMLRWLGLRGSQNWAPLIEIGNRAGEDVHRRLIEASKALTKMSLREADDIRELLILDIEEAFASNGEELGSTKLAELLGDDTDSPWSEYSRGRPLTPRMLSDLLRPFGIAPVQFRSGRHGKIRGYTKHQFREVFRQYGVNPEIDVKDAA
jgi:hypothetical protein